MTPRKGVKSVFSRVKPVVGVVGDFFGAPIEPKFALKIEKTFKGK